MADGGEATLDSSGSSSFYNTPRESPSQSLCISDVDSASMALPTLLSPDSIASDYRSTDVISVIHRHHQPPLPPGSPAASRSNQSSPSVATTTTLRSVSTALPRSESRTMDHNGNGPAPIEPNVLLKLTELKAEMFKEMTEMQGRFLNMFCELESLIQEQMTINGPSRASTSTPIPNTRAPTDAHDRPLLANGSSTPVSMINGSRPTTPKRPPLRPSYARGSPDIAMPEATLVRPKIIPRSSINGLLYRSPNEVVSPKAVILRQQSPTSLTKGNSKKQLFPPLSTEQKYKLRKLPALVRGYLVRRILNSEKVQGIKIVIRDTLCELLHFDLSNARTQADADLYGNLLVQLESAIYSFHDAFFGGNVADRMKIIEQSRQLRRERMFSRASSRFSVRYDRELSSRANVLSNARRSNTPVDGKRSRSPAAHDRVGSGGAKENRSLRPIMVSTKPSRKDFSSVHVLSPRSK